MKKMWISAIAALLAGGVLGAGELEFKLEKPADWKSSTPVKWIGKEKDVMEITGPTTLLSVKKFDIDVNKIYKLEADVKQIAGGPIPVCIGFKLFDKNDKEITSFMVNARQNSETTVLKSVKPGDKVMILKANPLWKKNVYAIALNAKKDLSDLPNYDILTPAKITFKGQEIEVQLKAPVAKAIPAGTIVRAHSGGGYMYTAGFKMLNNGQEVEFKGIAKGVNKSGMTGDRWAPGAAKAQVLLLVNWKWGSKDKAVAHVKDVELEIK